MFAVIKDDKPLLVTDIGDDVVDHVHPGPAAKPNCCGDRAGNQLTGPQRGEVYPPRLVEILMIALRGFESQPGLAGPAGAGQCDDGAGGQQVPDLLELGRTTDEGRARNWEA